MHTGNLAGDSPSLYSNLNRYLKEDEVLKITLAYALAAKHGALNETGVVRLPDASFNPRPARVAQILMTELRDFTAETLCCAILGCARIEEILVLPEDLRYLEEQLTELKEALKSPNESPSTAPCEASLYAILLDDVRHLHMTDFPIEYMKSKISFVQELIENKESFKENQRLVEKIKHALDKLEEFVQSNG
jgi:hypothetical protein